jgi:hypothetical protein
VARYFEEGLELIEVHGVGQLPASSYQLPVKPSPT